MKKSIALEQDPTAMDFGTLLQSIGYFILSSSDTCAMGELIAINVWDEKVNRLFGLCSELELLRKGENVLRRWNKLQVLHK